VAKFGTARKIQFQPFSLTNYAFRITVTDIIINILYEKPNFVETYWVD